MENLNKLKAFSLNNFVVFNWDITFLFCHKYFIILFIAFGAFNLEQSERQRLNKAVFTSASFVRVALGLTFRISQCAQCCRLSGRFC